MSEVEGGDYELAKALESGTKNVLVPAVKDMGETLGKVGDSVGKGAENVADDTAEADASAAKALSNVTSEMPGAPAAGSGGGGSGSDRISRMLRGENPDGHEYQYDMVKNPGPLAEFDGNPAANFAGGKYDEVTLDEDTTLYRGGDSQGRALGQWFTADPPGSVAHVRIDTAVKPEWIDPTTGARTGVSPIDTVYKVKMPSGTKVYPGPTGAQGGVYVGGKPQIFVPRPWENEGPGGVEVLGSEPLK